MASAIRRTILALLLTGSAAAGWITLGATGRPVELPGSESHGKRDSDPLAASSMPWQPAIDKADLAWETSGPTVRDRALRQTVMDLVHADGGIAAVRRWIERVPPGEKREELLRTFEFVWFGVDPDGALAWTAALPDGEEREEALSRMLIAQASSSPLQAIENAKLLGAARQAGLLDNLVQSWACQDPDAAQKWALNLPPGDERNRSIARVALVLARSFPYDAARLAAATIPPGEALDEAVISVVHQWALREPAAARAWVETFAAGELRERAMREVAGVQAAR